MIKKYGKQNKEILLKLSYKFLNVIDAEENKKKNRWNITLFTEVKFIN